tara:strand:+ start:2777 stop:3973 length:1197 start_codon:yes stop_codon:yes gene_type:complete
MKKAPIKVIFFHIMKENFSGAQKNIYRLLINLDKTKISSFLVGQGPSPLIDLIKKKNLKSKVIPYPKELEIYDQRLLKFNPKITYHFLKGLFIYNNSLKKEFHEISPDVVWCDNIRTLITIYPSCKSINAKIIWNIWSEPKGLIAWLLHRIGLILADKINLEYENQGKKIFGILNHIAFFKRKIIPLYTGVSDFEEFQGTDLRKELNLKDEEIILTMASNIVPGKGQLDLIKCIKNLKQEFSSINLVLAGTYVPSSKDSKEYYDSIKTYIKQNSMEDYVHLLGWRNDTRDIFKKSDIYISTSYSESFPDAVREAMRESLPIVVTDVGGTRELINNNKNGFLFNPGDLTSLQNHIRALVSNETKRNQMGIESKKIIETKFSTKQYAQNFSEMIENFFNV